MRNIHIIHASRLRPEQAKKTFDVWSNLLLGSDTYHVAIESDMIGLYSSYAPNDKKWLKSLEVIDSKTAINAFNITAEFFDSIGKYESDDIIIALSDDFNEPCDLELIREHCPKNGVLKTFDGIQDYIVTLPIMGVEYYWSKGHIYPPQYKHMFADTHLTHEAELEGKLAIRNHIVIKHNHYSIGGCEKDALNERNDKTFQEGMQIYLSWVKTQCKYLTSRESLSLRNWLKYN